MISPAYNHPLVRDLHWLINSPELITLPPELSSAWLFDGNDHTDTLLHLDRYPELIQREIRQQSRYRLGLYFEDLVRIYLKYFIQPIELKSNIQVFHDKTTVGEYDFLMQLRGGRKIHLETAVKFYLCTRETGPDSYADFIGPNRRDCLENKWQRLMKHQLTLSETRAGIDQALDVGLAPDTTSLLLKGYLFYSYQDWRAAPSTGSINTNHLRGWWMTVSEAEQLNEQPSRYALLMKPSWLSAAVMKWHATQDLAALLADIQQITTPMLVAQLSYDESSGLWRESNRGFIVPDDWNH